MVLHVNAFLTATGPRHSFCSRLLYTVLPSRCYNGDATIFQLLDHIAADCSSLFWDGLDVPYM